MYFINTYSWIKMSYIYCYYYFISIVVNYIFYLKHYNVIFKFEGQQCDPNSVVYEISCYNNDTAITTLSLQLCWYHNNKTTPKSHFFLH